MKLIDMMYPEFVKKITGLNVVIIETRNTCYPELADAFQQASNAYSIQFVNIEEQNNETLFGYCERIKFIRNTQDEIEAELTNNLGMHWLLATIRN